MNGTQLNKILNIFKQIYLNNTYLKKNKLWKRMKAFINNYKLELIKYQMKNNKKRNK